MAGEAEDGGCLADAWHARDDDVREVAVFGDYFEAGDCFGVADDVVEVDWAILFDPRKSMSLASSISIFCK